MAAAVAALVSLAMQSCSGCIGVVEWGDPGDGVPVEFAGPAAATELEAALYPEATP
jgi:hypothetical protein